MFSRADARKTIHSGCNQNNRRLPHEASDESIMNLDTVQFYDLARYSKDVGPRKLVINTSSVVLQVSLPLAVKLFAIPPTLLLTRWRLDMNFHNL